MNYLLINGFLVNEGICKKADVYIKDRKIEKIFSSPCLENQCPPGATILDIQGCYLLPGIIDDQVHFREPGLTHKADIASESRAAVAGGVTSFMDMPNTIPQTLTQNLLQNKYERASEVSLANYSFYMGCSEDNLTEVLKTDPKQVCGIKLFLGSSTGNMLVQDPVYIENLLKNAPTLVAAHCEDENIIARNTTFIKQKYGEEPPFSIHPQIRSKEACYSSSSKIAEVARKTGARLHILHISTNSELALLDQDTDIQKRHITGEVCVHHLWFTMHSYPALGSTIKWNPAIKTSADREALRLSVKEGLVIVATDHAPHTWQEKQESYFRCPSGGPLVQHSLAVMMELVYQGVFTIEEIVEALCHRPALLFGVEKRGFIREGYAADLTVVDPRQSFTVKPNPAKGEYNSKEGYKEAGLFYKCGWSPFAGTTFHSTVKYTFVNGALVFENGKIIDEESKGERLSFEKK